jgi:hypothetical protein
MGLGAEAEAADRQFRPSRQKQALPHESVQGEGLISPYTMWRSLLKFKPN